MKDSGRRWLIAAVGLFAFLLVGWVLLALQLNSALAGPLPFGPGLMSKLSADYRADEGGRSVALIALSILEPAMQALGLTDEEAAAAHESLELAMSQPVPTATAMDFDGAAPFTATPTITNTPLPTKTPTPTATNTRRPPTKTPKPTKTDEPPSATDTPSGPTATAAPTAISDAVNPVVAGADFSPLPGSLYACTITVTNLQVTDAIGSSGISAANVGVKYYNPDLGDFVYMCGNTGTPANCDGQGMSLDSGGIQVDTSWDASYSGVFTISGVSISGLLGSLKFAAPAATYEDLPFAVFAYDNQGNFAYSSVGTYRLYVDCP